MLTSFCGDWRMWTKLQCNPSFGNTVVFYSFQNLFQLFTDSGSIRIFFRKYDQYVREVSERAHQIVGDGVISLEVAKPVQLTFCDNPECLELVIDLSFIPGVDSYAALQEDILRQYLESKSTASRDVITINTLYKLVETHLRIDMNDMYARRRIKNLSLSYKLLLHRHGLAWLTKDNKKIA